jgi:hypothetical protein
VWGRGQSVHFHLSEHDDDEDAITMMTMRMDERPTLGCHVLRGEHCDSVQLQRPCLSIFAGLANACFEENADCVGRKDYVYQSCRL